jgi:hypothetical protein
MSLFINLVGAIMSEQGVEMDLEAEDKVIETTEKGKCGSESCRHRFCR